VFAANVAHAYGFAGRGGEGCAGDVADFGAGGAEFCSGRRSRFAGEGEQHAAAIYVAARADAFHNLLAGVAAFCETNVCGFERGFVRDYGVVEIAGEPGDAGFEAQRVERGHPDGGAMCGMDPGAHALPKQAEMFSRRDNFCAVAAKVGAAYQVSGHAIDRKLCVRKF
jgi:hypothetical protein